MRKNRQLGTAAVAVLALAISGCGGRDAADAGEATSPNNDETLQHNIDESMEPDLQPDSIEDTPDATKHDPPEDMPELWAFQFTFLKDSQPDNEWLQEVLGDWQVSLPEAQESLERFQDCLEDKGWVRPDVDFGGGGVIPVARQGQTEPAQDSPEFRALESQHRVDEAECSRAWQGPALIFFQMNENPAGLTWEQNIIDCFTRNQLPGLAGLTADVLTEAIDTHGDLSEVSLESARCLMDPTGEFGVTTTMVTAAYCDTPRTVCDDETECIDLATGGQSCVTRETDRNCRPIPPPLWCP